MRTAKNSNLKIANLNARSLFTHFSELKYIVEGEGIDILGVTETWLRVGDSSNLVNIPDYRLFRMDRPGRGGGLGFYVRSHICCKVIESVGHLSAALESLWIEVRIGTFKMAVGALYRPPENAIGACIEIIDSALSLLCTNYDHVLCLGDINVDILTQPNNCISTCFSSYGFSQLIGEPTRITATSATLLDPVFLNCPGLNTDSGVVNTDLVSDHSMSFCNISVPYVKRQAKFVTYRNYSDFNLEAFLVDLQHIPWDTMLYAENIDEKVAFITENLLEIFNIHAPVVTVRVTRQHQPWITDVIKMLMHERDVALNRFKSHKSQENWKNYTELRNFTLASIRREKAAYMSFMYQNKNAKTFWNTLSHLSIRCKNKNVIPENLNNVDKINDYFASVYNKSVDTQVTVNSFRDSKFSDSFHFTFRMASVDEVTKALLSIKSQACGCDLISPQMLRLCCPFIAPYVTHIINNCLEEGYFPEKWREAVICPIPKVSSPTELKDLRPISLLPVLGKVLEKIVYNQMNDYLNKNKIIAKHQSGFRASHSTTTALLDLCDNIVRAYDRGMATVLLTLDFSKAFDTIDHELICAKLDYYGFDDLSHSFFNSYLRGRTQRVRIDNCISEKRSVCSGVPQGSILGPLLFILYTADMNCCLDFTSMQAFADDTQILHHFCPGAFEVASNKISSDLVNISHYCKRHNLKLNCDKTNILLISSKPHRLNLKSSLEIRVGDQQRLHFVSSVKILGLIIDEDLRFQKQVNIIVQKCYSNLKLLYSNRDYLNFRIRKLLCESLIMSVIGYCDLIYYPCLDSVNEYRLQKIQNACCRLIFSLRKYDHISNKIIELEWMKLNDLVRFHYVTLIHKILYMSLPIYLHDKLVTRDAVHQRDIRFKNTLTMPMHSTSVFRKGFTYNAVVLYNAIDSRFKGLTPNAFKYKIKRFILNLH